MIPSWSDCQAAPDEIDPREVRAMLTSAFETCFPEVNSARSLSDKGRAQIQSLFDGVLKGHLGPWVEGWCWSSGDGGFVQNWCCSTHSVFGKDDRTMAETIGRVVCAVEEWWCRIRELREIFKKLQAETEGEPQQSRIERAARVLVNHVVEINNASDAWHYAFQQILIWYLEEVGIDPEAIDEEIETAIEGQFESWIAPTGEGIATAAVEIGEIVGQHQEPEESAIDTTQRWCAMRPYVDRHQPFEPRTTVDEDKHREFISEHDYGRSEARGTAMIHALDQCREDAMTKVTLDWERLRAWQAIVLQLGEPPEFRSADAFAKQGRERYPLDPGTAKQFRNRLVEVNDTERCPIARATTVYLDICFFHPFEDGNARSARLALDYVLTLHGFALLLPEPIFKLAISPRDYHTFEATLRASVGKRMSF